MSDKGQLRATLIVDHNNKVVGFRIPADITETGIEGRFELTGQGVKYRAVELVPRQESNEKLR